MDNGFAPTETECRLAEMLGFALRQVGTGIVCEGTGRHSSIWNHKNRYRWCMIFLLLSVFRLWWFLVFQKLMVQELMTPEYCDRQMASAAGRTAVGSAFVRHSEGVGAEYRYTGSDLSGNWSGSLMQDGCSIRISWTLVSAGF